MEILPEAYKTNFKRIKQRIEANTYPWSIENTDAYSLIIIIEYLLEKLQNAQDKKES